MTETSEELHPPRWRKWRYLHRAYLWQWLMVSIGADPEHYIYPLWGVDGEIQNHLPASLTEEFRDRLEIAHSALESTLYTDNEYSDLNDAAVERGDFIRWARTVDFDLPAEMVGREPVEPSDSAEGTKRGRSLYRLVLGMAVRQYNYQPRGENRGIAQTIAQDLELAGISLTDDTIRECLKAAMKDLSDKERAALQPKAKTPKK